MVHGRDDEDQATRVKERRQIAVCQDELGHAQAFEALDFVPLSRSMKTILEPRLALFGDILTGPASLDRFVAPSTPPPIDGGEPLGVSSSDGTLVKMIPFARSSRAPEGSGQPGGMSSKMIQQTPIHVFGVSMFVNAPVPRFRLHPSLYTL
ncbi:hypothetical protein FRB97_008712 [Tulasnella sp. 331]|nr:hypothetical protein FRB97_008712 [Tulasnella sp. 331]